MPIIKIILRVLFAAFLIVAGISHFTNEAFFTAIVPPYLPWPVALVYVSGVAEIMLGALLLMPRLSALAGWGTIALLVAVFPANIHMAVHPELFPGTSPTALYVRLALQGVLIALAYWLTRADGRRLPGRPGESVTL